MDPLSSGRKRIVTGKTETSANDEIRKRLEFEQLISGIATGFINLPAAEIDPEIETTLRLVAEFFQVDRGTIFQLSHAPKTLQVVHTYASEGVDPVSWVDVETLYPWCWENLKRGEPIMISALSEMPEAAAVDLENMRRNGVQSFVAAPVRIKGDFRFVFTLTCLKRRCRWHPKLVHRIQLVGQLLGNALHRKEMESHLSKLASESRQFRDELSHRDRIGTVGALTAALSHEINQPLTAIISNAQAALHLLARDAAVRSEMNQILTDILSDGKRAGEIIHNIRRMLKKEERHHEWFDLNAVVGNVLQLTKAEAVSHQTAVKTDLAPDPAPVWGDPVLIQQVILNLILNAMEAMADRTAQPAGIMIQTRNEPNHIAVHVCDSGAGIFDPMQQDMFQPFFTAKPGGLGIGLILCRSIIEAHGGSMSAENRPEGGACFSFRLPL